MYNINRRKFLGYFGCGCCSMLLPSCSTVPITERKQLSIIPESRINAQAAAAYEQFRNKTKLSSYGGRVSRKSLKTYWSCIKTTLDMDSTIPAGPSLNVEPTVAMNMQENSNQLLQMHQMFGYHEDISHDDVNSFL